MFCFGFVGFCLFFYVFFVSPSLSSANIIIILENKPLHRPGGLGPAGNASKAISPVLQYPDLQGSGDPFTSGKMRARWPPKEMEQGNVLAV